MGNFEAQKIQVAVLGPPLDQSGGIGALYTYAAPCFPEWVKVKFIDTRGYKRNPIFSFLPLFKALSFLSMAKRNKSVDLVHVNFGSGGSALRKMVLINFAVNILNLKVVAQLHAATFEEFFLGLPHFVQITIVRTLNRCTKILVLGKSSQEMLVRIGIHGEIINVFRMGIPDLKFDSLPIQTEEKSKKSDPKIKTVLFAGELSSRKGLPELIQAAISTGSDVKYIVAGSGDLNKWKDLALEFGVMEKIAFVGLVPYSAIHFYFQYADALILPSRAEGLPVSVLESFSAGVVPIVTLAGNLGDVLNSENSFIIQKISQIGVLQAINDFTVAFESQTIGQFSSNCRNLWSEQFDVKKTTKVLSEHWLQASGNLLGRRDEF